MKKTRLGVRIILAAMVGLGSLQGASFDQSLAKLSMNQKEIHQFDGKYEKENFQEKKLVQELVAIKKQEESQFVLDQREEDEELKVASKTVNENEMQKPFTGWAAYVLNIRQDKSIDSKKLGQFAVGDKVEGYDEGEWVRFDLNQEDAYVMKKYLSIKEIVIQGSKVQEEKQEEFWLTENVNVRSMPTISSEKLGLMPKGTSIVGIHIGAWVEFEFEGKTAYLIDDYLVTEKPDEKKQEEQEIFTGWTTDELRVRTMPSVDSEILDILPKGSKVTGNINKDWIKFDYQGKEAFVHKNYLSTSKIDAKNDQEEAVNLQGVQGMIALAKSKVGSPYVFASSGPNAFDCSGFTSYLYREVLGINLPRNSEAQWNSGYERVSLNNLQPGDILYHPGHVAFYIGNGQYVHASTYGVGVVYGNMSDPYSNSFVGAIRVL